MHTFSNLTMLFLLSLFVLSGCSDGGEQQAVDQSYLNSENYQEFEQKSAEERSHRVDEATAFERILKNFLTDQQTNELNLPLKVDSLSLDDHVDSSTKFELKQSMLNEPAKMNYTYYPVGKVEENGLNLLFFVIRKQSMYNDWELAVATFKDTSLIEVQSLGRFNKTLSQQVQSTIRINREMSIISEIIRRTKYPVPQKSNTTYRYTINNKGEIIAIRPIATAITK